MGAPEPSASRFQAWFHDQRATANAVKNPLIAHCLVRDTDDRPLERPPTEPVLPRLSRGTIQRIGPSHARLDGSASDFVKFGVLVPVDEGTRPASVIPQPRRA